MAGYSLKIDASVFGADRVKALNKELAGIGKQAQQLPKEFTKSGREIKTAANGFRYYIDAAGRARTTAGRFASAAEQAAAGLRDVGRAAKGASGGINAVGNSAKAATAPVNGLGKAIRNLFIGYQALQGLKFIFNQTAELETQTRSLEILTGSLEEAERIISDLQDFAAVTPFTSTEIIDAAKRLKAYGIENENIVDLTKRLGDVAGATGARIDELGVIYGQVFAKGKLQTEELYQLQERGIDIATGLKETYGLTGEEFVKAMEAGQISAAMVTKEVLRLTDAGGKYADGAIAQSSTLAGKFSTLTDNVQKFAKALGKQLAPIFKWLLDRTNELLSKLNQALALLTDASVGAAMQDNAKASAAISLFMDEQGLDNIQSGLNNLSTDFIKSAADAAKFEYALNSLSTTLSRVTDKGAANLSPGALDKALALTQQIQTLRNQIKALKDAGFEEQVKPPSYEEVEPPKPDSKDDPKKTKYEPPFNVRQGLTVNELEGLRSRVQRETLELQKQLNAARAEGNAALEEQLLNQMKMLQPLAELGALERSRAEVEANRAEFIANGLTQAQLAEFFRVNALRIEEKGLEIAQARLEITGRTEEKERQRNETVQQLLDGLDEEIAGAQELTAEQQRQVRLEAIKQKLQKQGIELTEAELNLIKAKVDTAIQPKQKTNPIGDLMKQWKGELENTQQMVASLAQTVQTELGNAMANAITGLIDGTKTAQQAFADMFKNIGRAFIQMATQMIAKALILKALGVLFPGAQGFSFGSTALGAGGGSVGGIGTLGPNFGFPARANGGPVNAGQPYLVGEMGPELVIPNSSGVVLPNDITQAAMQRFSPSSSGSDDPGGLDQFGSSRMDAAMAQWNSGTAAATSGGSGLYEGQGSGLNDSPFTPQINVSTGDVLAFDDQRYVKQEDFQAGLSQAARQGAKQGEAQTLRKLRMSQSARRKLGF